ncbi:response regulator transcription factor [Nocardioides sp.]|uniref:helix-turn-helix transcriptional regulator n=1 Tax=Nocardioides sp. TaxID=35761 RepID=UPI002D808B30|nr:response regulator transcription factor [Nocardioides sp.]
MGVIPEVISTAIIDAEATRRAPSQLHVAEHARLGHTPLHVAAKPLRVTVVGDDEITVRGLSSMVGMTGTIELVRLTRSLTEPVDIALYDHAHAGATASRPTLAQLLADARIRRVALFTWNFQPWSAPGFLEQGAAAYLPKSLNGAELVAALHAIHNNQRPSTGSARTMADTGGLAENGEILTEREAQVLSFICQGRTNTNIAGTLGLSVNTVKSYVRGAYRKIEVESRSRAVLWGLEHGFGSGPGADPASGTRSGARS